MAGQIRTRRTTWPRRSMQGGGWSSIAMACYSTRGAQLSSGLRCACHSSPQRPGTISNEASVPQNLFGWAECLPEQFGPSFSDLALGENRKCRVKLSKDLVRIIDFQITSSAE